MSAPPAKFFHIVVIASVASLAVRLTPSQALAAAATSTPARIFSPADRGTIAAVNNSANPVVGMVSNFDDGTTKTSIGMGWVVSTDQLAGGASTAAMKVVDGGANGTPKSLETTGVVAPGLPYAWAGPMFMPGAQPMSPVDLSAAKALHFWAKGDGKTYHVVVFSTSHGQMPLTVDFTAGADWKEYTFPFSAFEGIDGHDIMGIAFTAGPQPGLFSFRIDEVTLK